ncbi:MAG: hypothetical protein K8T20_06900 [Planctomycetes bacterium]|nr:hypothetical protein [Planctomycetota bacterium]
MMAILGVWVAVGLTLFMFSFLYKDNPFYKVGENLYVGITIGYSLVKLIFETWIPNVWRVVHPEAGVWFENHEWWLILPPLFLGSLILTRFVPKYAWLSRWTFAFVVGYGSGLAIPAVQKQAEATAHPLVTHIESFDSADKAATEAEKKATDLAASKGAGSDEAIKARIDADEYRERANAAKARKDAVSAAGARADKARAAANDARKQADEMAKKGPADSEEVHAAQKKATLAERAAIGAEMATWTAYSKSEYSVLTAWGDFTTIVLFIGVFSVLFYFFFSIEHKGPVKVFSRLGIIFLMIYFGASYGYTVMGRLSLLYGRLVILRDACYPSVGFATPVLLVAMITVLVVLHFQNKDKEENA